MKRVLFPLMAIALVLAVTLGVSAGNAGAVENALSGSIDISKFLDLNHNRVLDNGEPGLKGWEFTVSGVPGTFTTGPDGHVVVRGLGPGTYNVTEIVRDGWICLSPNPTDVVVTDGATTEVSFGNYIASGIGIDRMPAPPRYVVNDGMDKQCFGWQIRYHTTADYYTFEIFDPDGLSVHGPIYFGAPCNPHVIFTPPPMPSAPIIDTYRAEHSPITRSLVTMPYCWTVPRGATPGTYTAVIKFYSLEVGCDRDESHARTAFDLKQAKGKLIIFKYHDRNNNGQWDEGEEGLKDWKFTVSGLTDTYTTDENGYITIDVNAGNYTVTELTPLPTGWINTDPGDGSYKKEFTVPPGEEGKVQFGNKPMGAIQIEKRDADTGELIDLPGTTFKMEPNPYNGAELIVEDNDGNDANPAYGIILLENVPPGIYTITEIQAPPGYQLDSTPKTVEVTSTVIDIFYNTRTPHCVGLTPGYWKNWRNHYTPEQFQEILRYPQETIAENIEEADKIFSKWRAKRDWEIKILRAHLLATQLTLNLTKMPDMPNPDDAYLLDDCQVAWNGEPWTVGKAVKWALDIHNDPDNYSRWQILEAKDILDMINNMGD